MHAHRMHRVSSISWFRRGDCILACEVFKSKFKINVFQEGGDRISGLAGEFGTLQNRYVFVHLNFHQNTLKTVNNEQASNSLTNNLQAKRPVYFRKLSKGSKAKEIDGISISQLVKMIRKAEEKIENPVKFELLFVTIIFSQACADMAYDCPIKAGLCGNARSAAIHFSLFIMYSHRQ